MHCSLLLVFQVKSGDLDTLILKMDFGTLKATVIHCTAQVSKKYKNLGIISAAEKFLGLKDFTTEVLQGLRIVPPSQEASEPVFWTDFNYVFTGKQVNFV